MPSSGLGNSPWRKPLIINCSRNRTCRVVVRPVWRMYFAHCQKRRSRRARSSRERAGAGLAFVSLVLPLTNWRKSQEPTQIERVTVWRDLTPDEFREHLRRSNDTSRRYIINFRRREIFGAGVGHFSPIAGYFENEDLVFVLDVNENFRPWLIERSRLFAAMNTLDGDKKRGLLLIE
jgi:hypothetical protein